MDPKQKQSFDRWLQREYPTLYRELTDTDSLHDAYIIINRLPQIVPDEYLTQMKRAYLYSHRRYAQYIFRFIVPDPRFWLFQDEIPQEESFFLTAEDIAKQGQEQEEKERINKQRLDAFSQWVRVHYDADHYIIFRRFYYERLDVRDIARLTRQTKQTIMETIKQMCDDYRDNKRKQQFDGKKQERPSTAKYCSICFRISKHGQHQIIPSVQCIKYLQLHNGSKLLFRDGFKEDGNAAVFMTVTDVSPYTCTLHSGTRPYNLVAQNKIVKDILQIAGAERSATLAVRLTTATSRTYIIDTTNPIKID